MELIAFFVTQARGVVSRIEGTLTLPHTAISPDHSEVWVFRVGEVNFVNRVATFHEMNNATAQLRNRWQKWVTNNNILLCTPQHFLLLYCFPVVATLGSLKTSCSLTHTAFPQEVPYCRKKGIRDIFTPQEGVGERKVYLVFGSISVAFARVSIPLFPGGRRRRKKEKSLRTGNRTRMPTKQ